MKSMPSSCLARTHAWHRMWASSRQRGSVAVMAAIAISTMVILLASIDIGYLFFQKRELQKIADLSALAGAQQLVKVSSDSCASAFTAARGNADAQVSGGFTGTYTISCGKWDEATSPYYQAYLPPNGLSTPNAISVQVSRSFRSFFGAWASRDVAAIAIATSGASIAVFSVGSKLLQVNGGVVPGLLTKLGVNINGTALVSYNGLANVSIKTGGLLSQLGFNIPVNADVGTIKQIVSINTTSAECSGGSCPLSALLGAMATVGSQQNLINLAGFVVNDTKVMVKLFSDATSRGIFTLLDAANGQAALNTDINLLELVTTTIGVANSHRGVPAGLNVNLPNIVSLESDVGIVEPPSIGIGGIGTTAFTSQVRLFSRLQSNLLAANLLTADIPLIIDVVNGSAMITDMCRTKKNGQDTATIAINAPILQLCVGGVTATDAFSTAAPACNATSTLPPYTLLRVLGNSLQVNTSFKVDALQNTSSWDFVKGEMHTFPGNSLPLGTTVQNLMDGLLANLLNAILGGKPQGNGQGTITNVTLAQRLLASVSQTGVVLDNAIGTVKDALTVLNQFITSLGTNPNLLAVVGNLVVGLLSTLGTAVGNLFTGIGNILVAVVCGFQNQCILANQLDGTQNGISKVLLTVLGLVTKLLEPILDGLGTQIAGLLNGLLGISLGQVDVTLIDLQCGGGSNVRLVF